MKNISVSLSAIRIAAIMLLVLSLLPLLLLSLYAVPAADDFSYGASAHQAYLEDGFLSAAAAAAEKTIESYFSWQGSFSAIFLMALQPAVFSLRLYALTPVIMLLSLILGTFAVCRALFSRIMEMDTVLSDSIAALLCILCVQLMPSPVQGLYWFNGAVYYTFFHGMSLLACALGVAVNQEGGRWQWVLLCLLGLMLGGGNYVTGLGLSILLVLSVGLLMLKGKATWRRLLLPGGLFLLAFALNMTAPGNAVRQAAQENTPGALTAVFLSFGSGIYYGWKWLTAPVLGALVLVGALAWQPLHSTKYSFRYPGLVSLFSFCLFSALFCPPLYAMGNVGDQRLLNLIFFSYLLLLTVNVIWWLGWRIAETRTEDKISLRAQVLALWASVLLLIFCCGIHIFRGNSFSSLGGLSLLRSGEAASYYACAQRRFALLEEETEHVVLEPFPCKPYLLYFDDITTDPEDWRNEDMSSFFGKQSVILGD